MSAQRSIVIGGGAFAGLGLALALRQGLGAGIPIIVADPALALRPSRDPRATAIVAACRRLFDAIGVWDQVAGQAQPILDMVVTDSKLEDATRPVFLTFAGHVEPGEPFAHMVENRHLIDVLVARAEAARIVALSAEEFHGELEQRFGLHLGEIKALDRPRAFPLGYFVARSFIGERLALVGDAAHVIHPIAGQGLNMGLKDVAALAEVIVDAARLGMDLGQADVLDRYQRWRRFDTMAMGLATNSLNLLFSNESTLLRTVRDIGLGLVDRAPPLKSMFIRQAAGLAGEVPRLLKGEAL